MRTSLSLESSHDIETESGTAYKSLKFNSKVFFAILVMILHIIDSILSIIAPIGNLLITDKAGKAKFSLVIQRILLIRYSIDILTAMGFQYLAYSVTMKRLQIER